MKKRVGTPVFALSRLTIAVAGCFCLGPVHANPVGAQVASGSATFATQGKTLAITNTPGAIINWQGFSIGANETTRFNQATAASAVLNRVVGSDPSKLLGQLQSNGRVFLINPAGILVGAGAVVDTAGFVASTLNLSNADFLAGRLNFTATPGAGKVENYGTISTPSGGSVYLVGKEVENHGIINAPNGEVLLAAGQTAQLIDTGTPGVRVELTADTEQALNVGQILAESGRVGMVGAIVRNSGKISASSVTSEGGRVFLKATADAYVEQAGRIEATGSTGGTVEVLGRRVALLDAASIDASGTNGGGTILVGGDYQGKNSGVQNATISYVGSGVSLKADARQTGNGGKVVVWADDITRFYGDISARGGSRSGNGGFVEVSGKRYLDFQGLVSTAAAQGLTGTLLLDPTNITISTGTSTGIISANVFSGVAGTESILNASTLATALGSNSVLVDATAGGASSYGNVIVDAPIAWSSGSTLTLKSGGFSGIQINKAITATHASSGLTLDAGDGGANGSDYIGISQGEAITVGNLLVNSKGNVLLTNTSNAVGTIAARVTNGNSLAFANSGAILVGTVDGTSGIWASGTASLSAVTGGISQSAAGTITANKLALVSTGNVALANSANMVNTLAANITSGDLAFKNGQDLTIGTVSVPSAGVSPILYGINDSAGTVTLNATQIFQADTAAVITAGTLDLTSSSNITLNTATNMVGNLSVAMGASGNLSFKNGRSLTLNGLSNGLAAGGSTADIRTTAGNLTVAGVVDWYGVGYAGLSAANALMINSAITTRSIADGQVRLSAGAGGITSTAAGIITTKNLDVFSGGNVLLNAVPNAIGVLSAGVTGSLAFKNNGGFAVGFIGRTGVTATCDITLEASGLDSLLNIGGTGGSPANNKVTSTGGNISYIADHLSFNALTTAGAGKYVELNPYSTGKKIEFSVDADTAGATGYWRLSAAELAKISTPWLKVGSTANAGGIAVGEAVNLGSSSLSLATAGSITQTQAITFAGLDVVSVGSVTLNNTANQVSAVTAAVSGTEASFLYKSAAGFTVGTTGVTTNGGDITLKGYGTEAITIAGNVNAGVGAVLIERPDTGNINTNFGTTISGKRVTLTTTGAASKIAADGNIVGGANGVSLTAPGQITGIGAVTSGGTLAMTTTNGEINQGKLSVAGVTTVNAGTGSVSLINAANSFGGLVGVTGGAVSIHALGTLGAGVISGTDVSLSGNAGLALGGGVQASNLTLSSSAGAISQSAGAMTVSGTLTANAATGISLTSGNDAAIVNLVNSTSGNVAYLGTGNSTISGSNAGGGSFTVESAGNVGLGLISNPGGTVSVRSSANAIVDANDFNGHAIDNITAATASLSATTGIGSDNAIEMTVSTVSASNSESGNIKLDNTGGLVTNGVSAPLGNVSIATHSPLTIGSSGVSAGGDIILTAGGSSAGDTLTIIGPVSSSNGSIVLTAGSTITGGNHAQALNGTVSVHAGTTPTPPPATPTIAACTMAPTTPGCSAVLPTIAVCTSTPSAPGCSAVLPTIAVCTSTPTAPGCSAVLPTIAVCTSTPSAPGCSAVLPTIAVCTSTPSAPGCSTVLPTIAVCTSTPSAPGCSAVLPTIAVCTTTPSAPGCSAVLPTIANCTTNPAAVGCATVPAPAAPLAVVAEPLQAVQGQTATAMDTIQSTAQPSSSPAASTPVALPSPPPLIGIAQQQPLQTFPGGVVGGEAPDTFGSAPAVSGTEGGAGGSSASGSGGEPEKDGGKPPPPKPGQCMAS